MNNIKRIYLLPDAEIDDLYERPIFNKNEQLLYFEMTQAELDVLDQFRNLKTKVYLILQLAYFKAKNQFFTFQFEEVSSDVEYVLLKFFNKTGASLQGGIVRQKINQQKQIILALFSYKDCSAENMVLIEDHICELLRYYPKVHDAFRQLLTYLDNQKIIITTYRSLQDLFTSAFARETKRLELLLDLIPQDKQKQLLGLITNEDGITHLNTIRFDQKNLDETYIKLNGKWVYLYRAVDKYGQTVDFLLRAKRDAVAAKAFFTKAFKQHGTPEKVTVDKSGSNKSALDSCNRDLGEGNEMEIRQVKYLNNIVEQDHRFIKKRTRPTLGFKNFYSAAATITGIENIRMIQKGQIFGFDCTRSAFHNFCALMA